MYSNAEKQQGPVTDETQFNSLIKRLTVARQTYDDLLNRLNNLGHRVEDTNAPQVDSNVKSMKDGPRPGILAELTTETDLLHSKNQWLAEIVLKLERFF